MRSDREINNIIIKANRAHELFNDPLIQEFILTMRAELLNEFESTGLEDEKIRKDTWQKSVLLNTFIGKFKKNIKEGQNAKRTLSERIEAAKTKIFNP